MESNKNERGDGDVLFYGVSLSSEIAHKVFLLGGTGGTVMDAFMDNGVMSKCAELIVDSQASRFDPNGIRMGITLYRDLEEMVCDAHFDRVEAGIALQEPAAPEAWPPEYFVSARLLKYWSGMSSVMIMDDMKKCGYRPAILPELLKFGKLYPDVQRKLQILALGSPCALKGSYAVLKGTATRRCLGCCAFHYGKGWPTNAYFLAVRLEL